MSLTLPIVLALLVWATRRGTQVFFGNRRHGRLLSEYRDAKKQHGTNLSTGAYAPTSEQADFVQATYLKKLMDSETARAHLARARTSLSRIMSVVSFFSKRWVGPANGLTLIDVSIALVVAATFQPALLHGVVDALHSVGSNAVSWVVGTSNDAVPTMQEFLRHYILGMDATDG